MAGIDVVTYAAARKFVEKTVAGAGAIKGKNCVIDSITPITGGNRITFKWTLDDGTTDTDFIDVMDGQDGAKGDKGDTGATGATGAQGIQGIAGPQGIQGPKGDKGDTGATGAQGLQGIQGAQGIKGDKGDDGYPFLIYKQYDDISEFNADDFPEVGLMFMIMTMDYDPSTGDPIGYPIYRYTAEGTPPYSLITHMNTQGIKGEKGDKGDKGDTGAQGIQGEKGDKGDKGDTGETGAQGPQGIQGEQGPAGATGPKGDKGDSGEGIPAGGTEGQVLKKKSSTDYDTEWGEAASPLTFETDDFDVSAENKVSLDAKQRLFTGTLAEWNALSAVQKAKYGLVNITDDNETGESIIYSTDERMIGRWVDNKPLYQKTFSGLSISSTASQWKTILAVGTISSLNIKKLIHGEFTSSQYKGAAGSELWQIDNSGNLQIYTNGYSIALDTLTIRYTKSTD